MTSQKKYLKLFVDRQTILTVLQCPYFLGEKTKDGRVIPHALCGNEFFRSREQALGILNEYRKTNPQQVRRLTLYYVSDNNHLEVYDMNGCTDLPASPD